MSTRSLICEEIGEDKYKTIYCHWDGYLTHNGAMLLDHYNTKEKLEELLAIGNISELKPIINPEPNLPHSFDGEQQENVVIAYGRDGGEKNQESKILSMRELQDYPWIEFVYIFDKDGKWKYFDTYFTMELHDLQEGLDDEYKKIGIKRPPNLYGWPSDEFIKDCKKKQSQGVM